MCLKLFCKLIIVVLFLICFYYIFYGNRFVCYVIVKFFIKFGVGWGGVGGGKMNF